MKASLAPLLLALLPGSTPALQDSGPAQAEAGVVNILRCPDGGIRPQVVRDAGGVFHMVFLGAAAAETDLFYTRSTDGGLTFGPSMRVNTTEGSVDASDDSHGANIAVGPGGRVHLVWTGSAKATDRGPGGEVPLMYSRLDDDLETFTPERNLIRSYWGLTASPAVAAGADGRVYVFWHAPGDDVPTEAEKYNERRILLATSTDEGAAFGPGRIIDKKRRGASVNCGLDAIVDEEGTLFLFYRCSLGVRRDMQLMSSTDGGQEFASNYVDTWRRKNPPRATGSIRAGHARPVVSWETEGQVLCAWIGRRSKMIHRPISPLAKAEGVWRRRPAASTSAFKMALIVWLEGKKGAAPAKIAWRTFDLQTYAPLDRGTITEFPAGAAPEVFVRADDGFTIVY